MKHMIDTNVSKYIGFPNDLNINEFSRIYKLFESNVSEMPSPITMVCSLLKNASQVWFEKFFLRLIELSMQLVIWMISFDMIITFFRPPIFVPNLIKHLAINRFAQLNLMESKSYCQIEILDGKLNPTQIDWYLNA